jgi:hypothetical protein
MHPDAYELRMPTYGCTTCGAVHKFPFAARLCDHRDPKPENILPDPSSPNGRKEGDIT